MENRAGMPGRGKRMMFRTGRIRITPPWCEEKDSAGDQRRNRVDDEHRAERDRGEESPQRRTYAHSKIDGEPVERERRSALRRWDYVRDRCEARGAEQL